MGYKTCIQTSRIGAVHLEKLHVTAGFSFSKPICIAMAQQKFFCKKGNQNIYFKV